jgi:hypothetical protein
MPSNNPSNNVKHKVNGYNIAFSRTRNKWQVKNGNKLILEGNFKECRKYCIVNPIS